MLSKKLSELISELDYVQEFKRSEELLRSDEKLWSDYQLMKKLQKDAILFKQIGKFQAFKETSFQAQRLEKTLKLNSEVQNYVNKMIDTDDLLTYVTGEIERKVNDGLLAMEASH
ncbi:YlbF family regulator [Lactovum miscens]|uniref:Cell fate (Sporulation/competence/biofilm development) regulator YmcA (YheA/YmcA/DUF963 family) n=1 Tax=Lactovum miscens TaxID=190387 RepID=A0A841C9A3_9LACT|nr:YlbF family regulator [Lactovum miscens]MBB5887969.1 cell fate (sporulation/competence/biofilm development) regulator YmcA (YheA/YmcA/DUF963 family) [Lactovum miscens]